MKLKHNNHIQCTNKITRYDITRYDENFWRQSGAYLLPSIKIYRYVIESSFIATNFIISLRFMRAMVDGNH